jgi:hypothetical protein
LESARGADRAGELKDEFGSAGAADRGEEDQDDLLMIGGIGVFLPCAQEEAEICVADEQQQKNSHS